MAADLFELTHKTGINLSGNVDNLPEIFITCGLQDKRIEMSRKLYEAMKQENFNVHYITETGGHDWTYWDACIQNTIQILMIRCLCHQIGGAYAGNEYQSVFNYTALRH